MAHRKHTITAEDGTVLKLQIWDRAGDGTYGAILKAFYKKANAAMIIYDTAVRRARCCRFVALPQWFC